MKKTIIFETEIELDEFVAKHLISFIKTKEDANLGFATGNTPLGTYKQLIKAYEAGLVDFSKVKAFNLDEYAGMMSDHPCSFAKAMRNNLFDHINIPIDSIYSLNGKADDLIKECQDYEALLMNHPIDIQLLGVGMDGHIAYNEPGTTFSSTTHLVDLHKESIESSLDYGFSKIEDVPSVGMSQGIATISRAKQWIMMAKGKKKAALVQKMLEGEVSENFPSSIIQKHKNVIVVLDKEAASLLKEK